MSKNNLLGGIIVLDIMYTSDEILKSQTVDITSLAESLLKTAKKDKVEKVVIGAIILDDQEKRVLCLQRHQSEFMPGLWELPSGNKEEAESLADSIQREVQEETGLSVERIHQYVGSFDYISKSMKKARQFTFVVSTQAGEICLSPKEHIRYAWLQHEELHMYNFSKETKQQIDSVLTN